MVLLKRRKFSQVQKVFFLLISIAVLSASLTPLSSTSASAETTLITCTDLVSQKTIILKANQKSCKPLHAPALWHIQQTDSSAPFGAGYANLRTCTSKRTQFDYRLMKSRCAKHQTTNDYWRKVAPLEIPIVATASARGHDGATFALDAIRQNPDAPIAYYLISNIKTGQVNKVSPNNAGELSLSNLSPLTSYTFTIAAVSVDGTSPSSSITPVIITGAVPVEVVAPTTAPLAAPAFTLSSASETKTVNNAISGYTISSTGGAIASYAISPAAPAGLTFNTATGLLSGTPTATQSATTYTITATNASGSATATFALTVSSSAPSFILSSTSETRVATSALAGYTIDASAGAAVTSYSLVGTLPSGLNFDTSTGRITGTPTETRTATTYTIIGASASGETATATYRLRVTGDVGDVGPGGGIIFYYLAAGFNCGPTLTATCSYLEAAPSGWNTGSDPARTWAQSTPANYQNTAVTGTATGIGWGYRNTRAIIQQGNSDTATSAAAIADSYTVTVSGVVYDDWYLPSRDELNQMCKWARGVAWVSDDTLCSGGTLNTGSAVGFVGGHYWSSSEWDANGARFQNFSSGNRNINAKDNANSVRPVRAF